MRFGRQAPGFWEASGTLESARLAIPVGGRWGPRYPPHFSLGLQDHLQFPSDVPDVPASAQDLIRQLLCRQEGRLGRGGLDDFRNHPFFEGVDWERLATSTAPYIPELQGPMDTSNFDVDDDTLNHPVRAGSLCSRKAVLTLPGCGEPPRRFPKQLLGWE